MSSFNNFSDLIDWTEASCCSFTMNTNNTSDILLARQQTFNFPEIHRYWSNRNARHLANFLYPFRVLAALNHYHLYVNDPSKNCLLLMVDKNITTT